ncbi:MAG: NAD(P)-dependent oxidoreductase [Aggregatilineales bacterium]
MENNEVAQPNVLITGANSIVGLTVIKKLVAEGHKVYATTPTTVGAGEIRSAGGHPVYPDLTRASEIISTFKMAKTDILIHLEPQSFNTVPFNVQWDADAVETNTRAIVKAAEEAGVSYIVYVSFAFLYAKSDSADESAALISASTNPVVKAALDAEKAVKNSSIQSIILRAGYAYSADSAGLAELPNFLRAGRPVVGSNTPSSWVHAGDLASAITLAVEKRPDAEVLNITDGVSVSTNDFLAKLKALTGIGASGSVPGFLRGMFTTKSATALMALGTNVNSDKAKTALGWSPVYPSVDAGLEQILLKWRAAETNEAI